MDKELTASHPGDILRNEMNLRKLTKMDFARQLDISGSIFNELLRGRRRMTEPVAKKLEEALGITADYWMELQTNYDSFFSGERYRE